MMKPDDALHCPSNSILWLEFHGDVAPFDVTGHYPILAGFTSDESPRELYVAMVYPQPFLVCYTYIEDGAQTVEFVDERGKWRVASTFYVMVLRHDLLDVERPHMHTGPPTGPDVFLQTGPVYWTRGSSAGGPSSRMHLWESDSLKPVLYVPSQVKDGEASATEQPLVDEPESGMDGDVSQISVDYVAEKSFGQRVKEIQRILAGGGISEDGRDIRPTYDSDSEGGESRARNIAKANLRWQIELPLSRYLHA